MLAPLVVSTVNGGSALAMRVLCSLLFMLCCTIADLPVRKGGTALADS